MLEAMYRIVNFTKNEYVCIGARSLFSASELGKSNSTIILTLEKLLSGSGDWVHDKIGLVADKPHHSVPQSFIDYASYHPLLFLTKDADPSGYIKLNFCELIAKICTRKYVFPTLLNKNRARFLVNDSKGQYIDLYAIRTIGDVFLQGRYYTYPLYIVASTYVNWLYEFDCSLEELQRNSKQYEAIWFGDNLRITNTLPSDTYEAITIDSLNEKKLLCK